MTQSSEPAFPFIDAPFTNTWRGMTKRECFAAAALQGIMANPYFMESRVIEAMKKGGETHAGLAVRAAAELIAALNK